jgi:hypothetical protein
MSEFEFLSVLVSIIFGFGLTHILRGSVSQDFRTKALDLRLAYAGFFVVVLVLNWWVFFSWRNNEAWSFEVFLVLVLWAICHYAVAITLYRPDDRESDSRFEMHLFLLAFVVTGLFDILQTAMRGTLFEPWYYLPFVGQYIVLSGAGYFIRSAAFHRFLSTWFLVSILCWALIVRRFLA